MHSWKGDKKFGHGPPPLPPFGQNPKEQLHVFAKHSLTTNDTVIFQITNQKQILKWSRNLQTRTAVLRSEKLSMEKIRSRSSGGSLFIFVTICISNFLESHNNHSNTPKPLFLEESSDRLSTRWRPRESATYREYFRPRELKECVLQGFRWLGQTPAPLRIVCAEHLCNAGSQM